jgi:hypothetical protein
MSYGDAFWAVVAGGVGAAFAAVIACRLIGIDVRRRHHDVGSVVFLQLGVVFAVLLAFVFSEAWTEYNEAAQAIDLEVSAMHGIGMLAATLPSPEASKILSAEQSYLKAVVDNEWPVMAKTRAEDITTDHKLRALFQEVAHWKPGDSEEHDTKEAMLSLIAQAHTQRETRIYQAQNGIPKPLWWVLIGFTILLTLFVSLSAIQYAAIAVAISACFTISVASILVTARLLDFPFEGALRLQPTDFVQVIDKVSALLTEAKTP